MLKCAFIIYNRAPRRVMGLTDTRDLKKDALLRALCRRVKLDAAFRAVGRRAKMGSMGTRRPRRDACLVVPWARKQRGATPRLRQRGGATPYDILRERCDLRS